MPSPERVIEERYVSRPLKSYMSIGISGAEEPSVVGYHGSNVVRRYPPEIKPGLFTAHKIETEIEERDGIVVVERTRVSPAERRHSYIGKILSRLLRK